jgi:hypothetical protein
MFLRKHITNVLLVAATIIASVTLLGGQAFGDTPTTGTGSTDTNSEIAHLSITPLCSDGTTSSAYWQVTNSTSETLSVDWTAIDNGTTGSFSADPGSSQLVSYFDSADNNNTTHFTLDGADIGTTNATEAACGPSVVAPSQPTQPTAPTCVDGTNQQNLTVSWTSPNQVTVQTVTDAPLCSNVTVEFSSYIMPSTYNGQGFYLTYDMNNPANNVANPTAYPQTLFANQSATLAAGTDGLTTLTVNLPSSCNNTQVDIYYAPELTTIGDTGNGTANIASAIYPATGTCPTAPTQGGSGSGSNPSPPTQPTGGNNGMGGKGAGSPTSTTTTAVVTPAVITTPVVTAAAPQLAYTGESPVIPYSLALGLMIATGSVVYAVRKDAYSAR